MKKLITLLLVLTGMVSTASAWDNLYLLCGANSWTQNDSYKFTKIDGNTFYYVLNASDLRTNNFIFRIKDTSNDWGAWENEYSLTSTEYAAKKDETGMGFKIAANTDTKFAYIYAVYKKYNNDDTDWRWHLTANVIETSTTVAFVDIDNNWTAPVYAYAWLSNDVKILGNWQGTEMTYSNNVYTCEVPYVSGAKIKFSDKNAGNNSSEMSLAEDAVYKYNAQVETVNVSAGTLGKSTFSCRYPLNFDGITTVKAYRITSASAGVLEFEQITGSIAAKTGLYIEGDANANYDVPTSASASAASTLLVAGNGGTVAATASESTLTNYILTNKTTKGTAPLRFYKANGQTVPAGKAYLQIPTAIAGARESFWFDDETTGIAAVEKTDNTDNVENKVVYNLNGQRVANPTKGLYIVNGKKVIIK